MRHILDFEVEEIEDGYVISWDEEDINMEDPNFAGVIIIMDDSHPIDPNSSSFLKIGTWPTNGNHHYIFQSGRPIRALKIYACYYS